MDNDNNDRRSDFVRQRREKRPASSKPATKEKRRVEPSQPPILMRGSMMGTPMAIRQGHKPKRLFSLPLNVPGGALRLPALPVMKAGWRWVSGVMTIILGLTLYFFLFSPNYQVKAAEIVGLSRISSQDIHRVLDISNKTIFEINPVKMEEELRQKFPELTQVKVDVNLPNKVTIKVHERLPILAWKWSNDRTVWIDADGYEMPARKEDPSIITIYDNRPIPMSDAQIEQMKGPKSTSETQEKASVATPEVEKTSQRKQFMPKNELTALIRLAKSAPPNTNITYDKTNGLGWKDPRGWQIYFGTDMANVEAKMAIYKAIVNHVNQQGEIPVVINVAFLDAPFYRLEQ